MAETAVSIHNYFCVSYIYGTCHKDNRTLGKSGVHLQLSAMQCKLKKET